MESACLNTDLPESDEGKAKKIIHDKFHSFTLLNFMEGLN